MKAQSSNLDTIRTRPRFKVYTKLTPEEYYTNLKEYYKNHQDEFKANINRELATVSVKNDEDTYYKPYLSIRTSVEDEKCYIRGVFGPSSAVWTFFVFLYSLFSILWMVFITFWYVGNQIKTDDYQLGLPLSIVMLVLLGLTYAASRYGISKAKREMASLRRFAIESTLPYEEKEDEDDFSS